MGVGGKGYGVGIGGCKGGKGVGNQLSTFDAESKSAKIPKSHFQGVGVEVNFKLSNLSPDLKFPFSGWGGGERDGPRLKFPLLVGRGGGLVNTNFQ